MFYPLHIVSAQKNSFTFKTLHAISIIIAAYVLTRICYQMLNFLSQCHKKIFVLSVDNSYVKCNTVLSKLQSFKYYTAWTHVCSKLLSRILLACPSTNEATQLSPWLPVWMYGISCGRTSTSTWLSLSLFTLYPCVEFILENRKYQFN